MNELPPVICANCGHAYGISREAIKAGVPPHSAADAGLAAKLTGWYFYENEWLCGIVPCVPPPWVGKRRRKTPSWKRAS